MIIKIAHRGNIHGPNPERENNPTYIKEALATGYNSEIDVWYIDNKFYLGHDEPIHQVDVEFLKTPGLWCHAKSREALERMVENDVHCFWHQTDDFTLTSKGYIWTHPEKPVGKRSVIVCHSAEKTRAAMFQDLAGICSDYVGLLK